MFIFIKDSIHLFNNRHIYLNTLAERGLFGFTVVMLNLLLLLYLLYRYRPLSADEESYRMAWFAAAGAVAINLLVGLFNTTLHHEHAMLSMILIGTWLGIIDAGKASKQGVATGAG